MVQKTDYWVTEILVVFNQSRVFPGKADTSFQSKLNELIPS